MGRTLVIGDTAFDVGDIDAQGWPPSGETGKQASGQDRSVLTIGDNVRMDFCARNIFRTNDHITKPGVSLESPDRAVSKT